MASKRKIEPTDFDEIFNGTSNTDEYDQKKDRLKNRFDNFDENETADITIAKKQRNKIIALAVSASLVLIFFISILIISFSINKDEVYSGIYFNDYNLQGMSHKEVMAFVEEKYVKPFKEKKLIITYQDKEIETTLFEVTKTPVPKDIADAAYKIARSGSIFKRLKEITALKAKARKIEFKLQLDDDVLQAKIDALVEETLINKIEPSYSILPYSVTFKGGRIGQSVDNEKLEYDIYNAIEDLLENKNENEIRVTAETRIDYFIYLDPAKILEEVSVEPINAQYTKISKTEISISESTKGRSLDIIDLYDLVTRINKGEEIIYEELAIIDIEAEPSKEYLENNLLTYPISSSSSVNSSDDPLDTERMEDRETNILKAIDALNNLILMPGETFNFWDEMGLFGQALGYIYAYDDSAGATKSVIGGGISQLASNIYIAALLADFEIVEHHNYPYAPNYGPLGFDAHVEKPAKNLIFINSQDYPIRLSMTYEEGLISVIFLGSDTESNRTHKLYSETKPISFKTIYEIDPGLEAGSEIVVQAGIIGYEIDVYLNTLVEGNDLFSYKLATVHYKSRDEIIKIAA